MRELARLFWLLCSLRRDFGCGDGRLQALRRGSLIAYSLTASEGTAVGIDLRPVVAGCNAFAFLKVVHKALELFSKILCRAIKGDVIGVAVIRCQSLP